MRFDIFGKALRVLMPALCAALLLPACAAKEAEEAPVGMSITVDLRAVHRCSRISPEIAVAQAPSGTEYFDVRLVEFSGDSQELFLGGGTWNNDGSGFHDGATAFIAMTLQLATLAVLGRGSMVCATNN